MVKTSLIRVAADAAPEEEERLDVLLAEVRHYTDHLFKNMADSHRRRTSAKIDHRQSHNFFVSRERFERLREILVYLMHFCHHLPMGPDNNSVLQFRQFREHLLAHVALLKEPDVNEAAAHESRISGNAHDTRHLAERAALEITTLIRAARTPAVDDWRKLFTALKRYSAFWIGISNPRVSRIRESDMYLLRLADHLLHTLDTSSPTVQAVSHRPRRS